MRIFTADAGRGKTTEMLKRADAFGRGSLVVTADERELRQAELIALRNGHRTHLMAWEDFRTGKPLPVGITHVFIDGADLILQAICLERGAQLHSISMQTNRRASIAKEPG